MTREEKAVEKFLQSVEDCRGMQPAPVLRPDQELVCQGARRTTTIAAASGRYATHSREVGNG